MIKWRKAAASTLLIFSLTIPFSVVGAEGMIDSKPSMAEMNMQDMNQNMNDMIQGMNMQNMIPLRTAAESLGFTVMWNGMDNTITLRNGGAKTSMNETAMSSNNGMQNNSMMGMYNIILKIGSKSVKINNEEKMIQDAPRLMDDRTLVTKDFIDMFLKSQKMMEMK